MKRLCVLLIIVSMVSLVMPTYADDEDPYYENTEYLLDSKKDKSDGELNLLQVGAGAIGSLALGYLAYSSSYRDCSVNLVFDSDGRPINYDDYLAGEDEQNQNTWVQYLAAAGGAGLGSAIGVTLLGELVGKPTKNKAATYTVTCLTSMIYPVIVASGLAYGVTEYECGSTFLEITVFGALGIVGPVVNPFITMLTYKAIKDEGEANGTASSFYIQPYNGLMKSDNQYIPTIGIEVGI